jgi:hypothetical protein
MNYLISKSRILFSLILSSGVFLHAFCDGTLSVKTDPDGIEVWLDDKFVGDSPIVEKKMKPGRYALKLVDPVQHSSTVEDIFIQDGENTVIEKTIKSKFGSLKVNSDPEGAQVFISTELGKTPLTNDFMNPGKYRIELRSPNKKYNSLSEDITIPRGEQVNLTKTLKKNKILDNKALLRLALGAGAGLGFVWAIVEQGKYKSNKSAYNDSPNHNINRNYDESLKDTYGTNATCRTLGIIGGSLCLVGLEIVAFF